KAKLEKDASKQRTRLQSLKLQERNAAKMKYQAEQEIRRLEGQMAELGKRGKRGGPPDLSAPWRTTGEYVDGHWRPSGTKAEPVQDNPEWTFKPTMCKKSREILLETMGENDSKGFIDRVQTDLNVPTF
ncbi:hypothetical protein CYMTET_53115, partial [Cymbomonas tetramitiformis]